ncbi:NAD(P)H dehydrogenase (quinone) [Caballeronia glebae]|uniref:NAD(P)H dehydrogenase (Quinone) n=1 Tax=Caballeronia glebae TaxID=1777143 RepID=A0A158DI73_9BURK|nr:NAD(P)H dehydrogenase (quinone) [Caballeronia glebae]
MQSTPTGKVGLLPDRPVFVGIASGGVFLGQRANQPDFLTPYLTAIFDCIGFKSVHYLPLQATAFIDQARAAELREALVANLKLESSLGVPRDHTSRALDSTGAS